MKRILIISILITCSTLAVLSQQIGSFTDKRDGKVYKTVQIGDQTWMAENLAFNTGGKGLWKKNVDKYGYLYNWETAKYACPSGWHLPSKTDFETLLNNVGGSRSEAFKTLIPGGSSGFSALLSGFSLYLNGKIYKVGKDTYFWSSSKKYDYTEGVMVWTLSIGYTDDKSAFMFDQDTRDGFSVRCLQGNDISISGNDLPPGSIKLTSNISGTLYIDGLSKGAVVNGKTYTLNNIPVGSHKLQISDWEQEVEVKSSENKLVSTQTVKDIDGNVYNTVIIGTQLWMTENLKTTRYRDGSPINNITDSTAWTNQTTGAYCWYDNSTSNKSTYGALYNYYAVDDSRNICPSGWHVPTDAEWTTLTDYLGGESAAGGKLKATKFWNTGADNSSGFTAFLGGVRAGALGIYFQINLEGYWWSGTESDATYAWTRVMIPNDSEIFRFDQDKGDGISVRCVYD
jgi:uncharacterized protein (TIGR02145 family)